MNPTPLRALPSRRRQLVAAATVSAALFLGACSSPAGQDVPPTTASTSAPAPSATDSSASAAASASGTPAPSAETAVKELVAGFPTQVLPLPKGAAIQASSLEKGATVSVAQVTATTTETPAQILEFYTTSLTAQGFKAQPGDAVDGVPLKTYVRADGQEIVTVSVVVTSGTSTFTAGATLLPGSLK
ncbi:hypothetical protein [Specibacter sp. NPDC078709]|uniref:hypothetical protein n=1 Tax=Specibacter sp. NPDC078709 TaxID=3154364 RepID=UPI00342B8F09